MSALDDRWVRRYKATEKRLALKEQAIDYLGGHCCLCGYDKSVHALEFHHLNPRIKDFEISSKSSWSAIKSEIDKTILVCSNCHKEIHAGIHPSLLDDSFEESGGGYNTFD